VCHCGAGRGAKTRNRPSTGATRVELRETAIAIQGNSAASRRCEISWTLTADSVGTMLFRLITVFALVAGLGLFTVQNLTPALALVFLGFQTPTLPLSVWGLGAIAAGASTSLIMRLLFGLASLSSGSATTPRSPRETPFQWASTGSAKRSSADSNRYESAAQAAARTSAAKSDDTAWQDWRGYETPTAAPRPTGTTAAAPNRTTDDWEQEFSEDWDTSETRDRPPSPNNESRSARSSSFEANQVPQQTAQSGSTYSYGYQNPENSGVGKSEKVVDAEYRVLIPPYFPLDPDATIPPDRSPPPPPAPSATKEDNADDWFEDSPDNFEDPPQRS